MNSFAPRFAISLRSKLECSSLDLSERRILKSFHGQRATWAQLWIWLCESNARFIRKRLSEPLHIVQLATRIEFMQESLLEFVHRLYRSALRTSWGTPSKSKLSPCNYLGYFCNECYSRSMDTIGESRSLDKESLSNCALKNIWTNSQASDWPVRPVDLQLHRLTVQRVSQFWLSYAQSSFPKVPNEVIDHVRHHFTLALHT